MEKMHELIRKNVELETQLRQAISDQLETSGFLHQGTSTLSPFPTPTRLMAQCRSLMTTNRLDVLEAWKIEDEATITICQDLIVHCMEIGKKVRQAYELLCTHLTHRLPPLALIIGNVGNEVVGKKQEKAEGVKTTGVTRALLAYLRQHHSHHIPHGHALSRHVRHALPTNLQIGGHIETIRFVRIMLDFAWLVALSDPPLDYRKRIQPDHDIELYFSTSS